MIYEYFQAFEAKDLEAIRRMLTSDVVLQDPFVGKVEGKESVIRVYQQMFVESSFDLQLQRQYYYNDHSCAIEFHLMITNTKGEQSLIEGIDLIELRDGKIASLRAYLDTSLNK